MKKEAVAVAKQHSGARGGGSYYALGTAIALAALAANMETFAASGSATASAIVVEPVTITTNRDLVFSASGANMTSLVILSTYGGGGGMSTAPSGAAAASPASVTVSGDGSTTYAVTVPTTVTAIDQGSTATVAITASVAGGSSGNSQTVLIGGTMIAELTRTQGSYAGSVNVVIEYN